MKEELGIVLADASGLGFKEVLEKLEIPPREEFGDFSFPCFDIAKKEGINPKEAAERVLKKIKDKRFEGKVVGGYLNFFVRDDFLVESVLKGVEEKDWGRNKKGVGKKVLIDLSSPNIAKPFGIGHLRSTIIGSSIARILEFSGYEVIRLNFLGDWGTQFGKLLFGFKKFGDMDKLKERGIDYLYEIYVKSQKKEFEDAAREEFKKLEEGDGENLRLWELFRKISLESFNEIYDMLGVEFDVISYESDYREKAKKVIERIKKGVGKVDDGALIVDLNEEGLGIVIVQKADGTSLYVTRDLAAAIDRKDVYGFDKMIYEVGSEQKMYFKQLFRILELMGYGWAKNCEHVAHGLYMGKDGKRFSTRKGKSVSMKEVLEGVIEKAKKNILERENLGDAEAEKRARVVALAAIIYGDLKNYRENNVVFDIDRFLEFEGDTGPYLLYSYARANSILRKQKVEGVEAVDKLEREEKRLLKKIAEFPEVVERAGEQRAPNVVANYCSELARVFNEFYHACPVLGNEKQGFRLKIVEGFKETLKKGLSLLGIGVLERM